MPDGTNNYTADRWEYTWYSMFFSSLCLVMLQIFSDTAVVVYRGFIKGQASGKLTCCEQDLAINLPGCFHLLFLLSFIRKTKNARLKNPTDLLHNNLMKPVGIHVSRWECKWVGSRIGNFLSESCAYFLVVPAVFVQLTYNDVRVVCMNRILCMQLRARSFGNIPE